MKKSISELSWGETSFVAKLRLFFVSIRRERTKIHSSDMRERASGYSALSSTYYSIAGTAFAQGRIIVNAWRVSPCRLEEWFGPAWLFIFTWLPLGAWCYWRSLPLSNKVVEIIGYDGMSAAMCDVRQSILRKHRKLEEAFGCIDEGLKWCKEKDWHTVGLLHAGRAEIYRHKGERRLAKDAMNTAVACADRVSETNLGQAVRIYKQCAPVADWIGKDWIGPKDFLTGVELRNLAGMLAQRANSKDQFLKIKH